MILIWGSKVKYSDLQNGTFFCPREGGDRNYVRKLAARWFTFFFIPIFETSKLGEFVECSSCNSQYDPQVLSNPTSAELMDNLANGMRQAVVSIIRADGEIEQQEKDMAVLVMAKYSDTPYTSENLDSDLEALPATGLVDQMEKCAGILSPQGKESLLRSCILVAMADGDFASEEVEEVHTAGKALGMSKAHVSGAISEMRVEMASLLEDGELTTNEVEHRPELADENGAQFN